VKKQAAATVKQAEAGMAKAQQTAEKSAVTVVDQAKGLFKKAGDAVDNLVDNLEENELPGFSPFEKK
jgi:hypothetical protein